MDKSQRHYPEKSQSPKATDYIVPLTGHSQKDKTMNMENGLVLGVGGV